LITSGLIRVDASPKLSSPPDIFLKALLVIFPDQVFGKSKTKLALSVLAVESILPQISWLTSDSVTLSAFFFVAKI
jgi:hypothetical protein